MGSGLRLGRQFQEFEVGLRSFAGAVEIELRPRCAAMNCFLLNARKVTTAEPLSHIHALEDHLEIALCCLVLWQPPRFGWKIPSSRSSSGTSVKLKISNSKLSFRLELDTTRFCIGTCTQQSSAEDWLMTSGGEANR